MSLGNEAIPYTLAPTTVEQHFREMGIGNHALFNVELALAIDENPGEIGLIVIDGEKFGLLNKVKGRQAGDEALKRMGEVLSGGVRVREASPGTEHRLHPESHDTVSLLGRNRSRTSHLSGDEFAVILHEVDSQDKLEAWISRMSIQLKNERLNVSLGGKLHQRGESATNLLAAADAAMRANKIQNKKDRNLRTRRQRLVATVISGLATRASIDLSDLATLTEHRAQEKVKDAS